MSAPHPDIDELADLAEGLLTPSRTAALEAHLVGCPDCTRLLRDVRAVPALLADVPSPPVPPQVTARLDSALHLETARRTADADADAQMPAPTPIAQPRHAGTWADRYPRLRLAAAAAATVAVLGGGVALIGSQALSTGGSAESASAGGVEQMDRSVADNAAGGRAASPDREEAYAARLDALARRLRAREEAGGAAAHLTAAAASVQGLRVGMAAF